MLRYVYKRMFRFNRMKLSRVPTVRKKILIRLPDDVYLYGPTYSANTAMRVILDDKIRRPEQDAHQSAFLSNISFTADAIVHLAGKNTTFNIAEWIWHIEIIDGREWYIVTDKKA